MKTITKEFLNENAYRNYPIDDAATMEPYSGTELQRVNSLLIDMSICIPKSVAACVFVSSISVTENLVTMTLMGSNTNPFAVDAPATTSYAQEYSLLGAVVLAHVQAVRSNSLPGAVVPIVPVEDGVGGWVVFGPGVLTTGSWHFANPAAAMVSDRCVTRLSYDGIFSIGVQGFETTLDGAVSLQGQQGIEVVKTGASDLEIRFAGSGDTVRRLLSEFVGSCGGRPETGNCGGNPIRRINGILPEGPAREIVIALDKPMYATIQGNGDAESLAISSDLPLENFCTNRPRPPEGCVRSVALSSAQIAVPSGDNVQVPAAGTSLFFEVCGPTGCQSGVFTYVSQKPARPGVAVFESPAPVSAFGELFTRLEIDQVASEWQLYSSQGASLLAYGAADVGFRGSKTVQYLSNDYRLELGTPTAYDLLGALQLTVTVDAPDSFLFGGTYVRQSYRRYVKSDDSSYELLLRGDPDSSWVIYKSGKVVAAGPIEATGIGTQVQQYIDPQGLSAIRTVGVQAVMP
jgi:hypothetical protein